MRYSLLFKRYLRVLGSANYQQANILFVSALNSSDNALFVGSCAQACGQEYASLARWVPGTLTNREWVTKWNDTQTTSSYQLLPPDLLLCFSSSEEVVDESRALGIPAIYFVSKDPAPSKVLAAYCSAMIRGAIRR